MMQVLLLEGWPRQKGYANGVAAAGRQVFIAGMIGWDAHVVFPTDDLAAQTRLALEHIVPVLAEAGGRPQHIVCMTRYVTGKRECLAAGREVGRAYREVIGAYNAATSAVEVKALMEDPCQGRDRGHGRVPRRVTDARTKRAKARFIIQRSLHQTGA